MNGPFRWLALFGVVATGLGACSGRSTGEASPDDSTETGGTESGGSAGDGTGGTSNGDTSGGGTSMGGDPTGGTSMGGASGGTSGGTGGAGGGGGEGGSGEDDESLQCMPGFGPEDACGGNAVGSWHLVSICSELDPEAGLKSVCEEATLTSLEYEATGTLEVNETQWSEQFEAQITAVGFLPDSCEIGCLVAPAALTLALGGPTTCSTVAGGCECQHVRELSGSPGGFYEVDDGVATINFAQTYAYCSEDDALMLRRFGSGATGLQVTRLYARD